MKTRDHLAFVLLILLLPTATSGEEMTEENHKSDYSGMESREIKTLSAEDLEQLRQGHGWGLSLAAELNGVPGPRHLLEMQEEIGLSAQQRATIEEIYGRMKREAIPLGERLIDLERKLDAAFRAGDIEEEELHALLGSIAETRRDLRFTHLRAHLQTPPLLTARQIEDYGRLRGYGSGQDPCDSVPPGHDPEMWRRHNRCEG